MESPLPLVESSFSVEVKSLDDLRHVAKKVARACRGAELIYLTGPLGAGKTTFVQMFARARGILSVVNSPTFLMVKEYTVPKLPLRLVHADAYRAASLDDIKTTGLLDELGIADTISLIEWPERVPELEMLPHLHIAIRMDDTMRHVVASLHGEDTVHQNLWRNIHS